MAFPQDAIGKNVSSRLAARSAVRRPGEVPALIAQVGLVPMVLLCVVVLLGGLGPFSEAWALEALKFYGAISLGFLGGIRWGMAMRVDTTAQGAVQIAASVLPAIAAWVALLLPDTAGLGLLAAGLAGLGAWDAWSVEAGLAPSWYGRVRVRATLVATGTIALALLFAGF
jgi:hypothetical protein